MTPPPFPPPMPPVPFATIVAEPMPQTVRVLSILGMALGALAVLSPLATLAQYGMIRLFPNSGAAATQPAMAVQQLIFGPRLLPWTIGMNAASAAIGVTLSVVSYRAWRLRPSARRQMLAYAVFAIAWGLGIGAINATLVMPMMMEAMSPALVGPAGTGARVSMAVAGVVGGLLGLAYPICVLVFFRRPDAMAAFARGGR